MADQANTLELCIWKCRIDGCDKTARKKNAPCEMHRWRYRAHGDYHWQPPPKMNTLPCKVDGCDARARKHGFCQHHSEKFRRYGDPLGTRRRGRVAKFLEVAAKHEGSECLLWPWSKGRKATGYAVATLNGRTMGAHRAVCILAHGTPPFAGAEAAHSCGNGHLGCVGGNHLSWQTRQQNMADAYKSDLWKRKVCKRGEKVNAAGPAAG